MAEAFGWRTPQQYCPSDLIRFQKRSFGKNVVSLLSAVMTKIVTKFIATHIRRHQKSGKGRGVAFVSSNLRHLIQYSKESSSCEVACSIETFISLSNMVKLRNSFFRKQNLTQASTV